MSPRRGRPQVIDWSAVTPTLARLRREGAAYADLADYVEAKYGVTVSYQTVRTHVLAADPAAGAAKDRGQSRGTADATVRERLLAEPWLSVTELSAALGLPADTVLRARERVVASTPGYLIVPPRRRRETYSDEEMLDALTDAAEALGASEASPMSRQDYADWRDGLLPDDRRMFPSPLAYRRRYGAWNAAMSAAGLPVNEPRRDYEGLDREAAVVWLAHFLRELRVSATSMVDATVAEYRSWLRQQPDAPSEDSLRMLGSWGEMLIDAAKLEISGTRLPKPQPVWTGGRRKRERTYAVVH